jgi:hypothetical protein
VEEVIERNGTANGVAGGPKPEVNGDGGDRKFTDTLLPLEKAQELMEKGIGEHEAREKMDKDKGTALGQYFKEARQIVEGLLGKRVWKKWLRENYGHRIQYGMVLIYCQLWEYRDDPDVKGAKGINEARKHFPKKIKPKAGKRKRAAAKAKAKAAPTATPAEERERVSAVELPADWKEKLAGRIGIADPEEVRHFCHQFTFTKLYLENETSVEAKA